MNEACGRLQDGVHVFPVRVYYEDTDAGGVVYHANFLKYGERARSDLLRILGVEQSRLSVAFVVRRCEVEFKAPAHLDDLLEVQTKLVAVKGASLEAEHRIRRDGDELVRLNVRIACVNLAEGGRPARLPEDIRLSLEGLYRAT